jgi:phytoene dehydrogenase-like protein
MLAPRRKALLGGLGGLLLVWLLAGGVYFYAQATKITVEKVRTYLRTVDLSKLSGEERARALTKLATLINGLPYEERRAARLDREWGRWFAKMTEDEKASFVDATMPTGIKQALGAFEELPAERRRRTVDEALKRLKEAREQLAAGELEPPPDDWTNQFALSDELRQKMTTAGLKAYYSESSAQTKAELAPLLEELQRMMETGAAFRGRYGRPE